MHPRDVTDNRLGAGFLASIDDVVSLHPLNPLLERRIDVRVLNMAGTQIKVQSPYYIVPGTLVQLKTKQGFLMGETVGCLADTGAYDVEIAIQNTFALRGWK